MAAFTFIDTVTESDACMPGEGDEATSIRFHELVHTEQFRQLGLVLIKQLHYILGNGQTVDLIIGTSV